MHVRLTIPHLYIFNVETRRILVGVEESRILDSDSGIMQSPPRVTHLRSNVEQHNHTANRPTNQQHDWLYGCQDITYNYWKPSTMYGRFVYCLSFHYVLKTCISFQTCRFQIDDKLQMSESSCICNYFFYSDKIKNRNDVKSFKIISKNLVQYLLWKT